MANAKITIDIDAKQALKATNDLTGSVGQMAEQSKSVKVELKELKNALLDLEPGTAEFEKMAARAAELTDKIGDVNAQVRALASDTFKLDATTGVITGMAGAYGAVQGAAALLGVENEALMKTMVKLQAIQNVTNGLTQVANMLNKDSAAGLALRNTGTKLLTFLLGGQTAATGGATIATQALNVAMRALPILAIIGAVTALISVFSSMSREAEEARESLERLNKTNLDAAKLSLFQLKEANSELEQELRKIDLAVLEGTKTEKEANDEKRKLLNDRLSGIDEEIKKKKASVGATIFAMESSGQLEKIEGELYNDKVRRLKAYLELQDEEDVTLKRKKILLDDYLLSVDTEIKLREQLGGITKNEGKASEDAAKRSADAAKRRLELLFMIANQERINELERLKRDEKRLIEEEATDEEILAKKQEVNDKEKEISNAKYEFLIKEAKGNAQKIKLLETQRIGELEKLEADYQNNVQKFNDESEKRAIESANRKKKLAIENKILEEQIDMERELREADNEKSRENIRKLYGDRLIQLKQQQIETERDILLENTKLTEEERANIIAKAELDIVKLREVAVEESAEIIEETFQSMMQRIADEFTQWSNAVMGIVGAVGDYMNVQAENAAIERENQYNQETEALQAQLNQRNISEEEFAAKQDNLRRQKDAKDLIERRKQFKREKAMNIVSATMNMAQGILQALGGMPPPASFIMAALTAAMGGIQIATISSQQFKAARGGIVPGNQRKTVDSVPAMLAPGESVINSRSTAMFPNLLSEINQMGGGVPLNALPTEKSGAKKDIEPTFDDNKPMTFQVNVGVQEITNTQDRLTRYNELNQF
jgi:hypothetical protein